MAANDPWAVLGIPPGSSLEVARAARRRLAKLLHPDLRPGGSSAEMTLVNRALTEIESGPAPEPAPAPVPRDQDTFSVNRLPAEAFEALFLAAYGLGDILVAEEPYLLELYLLEPAPCFCRLTLVPDAGGSTVTVDVSPAADARAAPEPPAVIDVLVAELNALVSG